MRQQKAALCKSTTVTGILLQLTYLFLMVGALEIVELEREKISVT